MKIVYLKKITALSIVVFLAFIVGCEKEVSTSAPIEAVPVGYLFVDSNPKGAAIYEDGKKSGKYTPDSLSWLEEKEYQITLKKQYLRDTTLIVNVKENEKNKLFIDFYSNHKMLSSIKCTSDPTGSKIKINDSLTNLVTPYTFKNLIPGQYTLTYLKDNYRDQIRSVIAESNKETLLYMKLQDTSKWLDYNTKNSPIPDNYLNCIEIDNNGTVWMGTSEAGLVGFKNGEWYSINSDNSPLMENYITCMSRDQINDVVWIGTNYGLYGKTGDNWTVFNTRNSILESEEITTLTTDRNNTLWVGTKNGLYSYSEGLWTRHKSARYGEPFTWISAVAFDTENNIWVGTYKRGIGRSIKNAWWIYTNNYEEVVNRSGFIYAKLPSNSITSAIVEVDAGRIWFGHLPTTSSYGGVSVYNQVVDKWSYNGVYIPSPMVQGFYYDHLKYIWICTDAGLVRWKNTHKTYFPDYNIKAVAVDKNTNIVWIATLGNGLIKLKQQ